MFELMFGRSQSRRGGAGCPCICAGCERRFDNVDAMVRHISAGDCPAFAVLHCKHCDVEFEGERADAQDKLSKHEARCPHRPVTCRLCGEGMAEWALQDHVTMHFKHEDTSFSLESVTAHLRHTMPVTAQAAFIEAELWKATTVFRMMRSMVDSIDRGLRIACSLNRARLDGQQQEMLSLIDRIQEGFKPVPGFGPDLLAEGALKRTTTVCLICHQPVLTCRMRKHMWWHRLAAGRENPAAAAIIQRAWRKCISDPDYKMCNDRLAKEFNEMEDEVRGSAPRALPESPQRAAPDARATVRDLDLAQLMDAVWWSA